MLSSDERVSPSGRILSLHACPLPWGEGESFAALVSDRFALNGRSATTANEASETQNLSATVPSPCCPSPVGTGEGGRRPGEGCRGKHFDAEGRVRASHSIH